MNTKELYQILNKRDELDLFRGSGFFIKLIKQSFCKDYFSDPIPRNFLSITVDNFHPNPFYELDEFRKNFFNSKNHYEILNLSPDKRIGYVIYTLQHIKTVYDKGFNDSNFILNFYYFHRKYGNYIYSYHINFNLNYKIIDNDIYFRPDEKYTCVHSVTETTKYKLNDNKNDIEIIDKFKKEFE